MSEKLTTRDEMMGYPTDEEVVRILGVSEEEASEVRFLAIEAAEGELTTVWAQDFGAAKDLVDKVAKVLKTKGWLVVQADAREATDETGLAQSLLHSLSIALEEQGFNLTNGLVETLGGINSIVAAMHKITRVRDQYDQGLLFVLHGVDWMLEAENNDFADGSAALWAIRGVWQRAHGSAFLTGGPGALDVTCDKKEGFYCYGGLHEVGVDELAGVKERIEARKAAAKRDAELAQDDTANEA